MKQTVNTLRFALLLGFVSIGMTVWSQAVANIEKMSVTTQMFLDELAGRITFEEPQVPPTRFTAPGVRPLPAYQRPIASPDTIDGKVYISAIVRVSNDTVINELEALGVLLMAQFDHGLLTANLPVDSIESIAALEGVTRINVSSIMTPVTDRARIATNVDDVLTLSNDARDAGLLQMYDGKDVILGVVDVGIDFQHGAFKDKNGSSRIKGAYCYNGSMVTADWTGNGTLPTTDKADEDHGTHTSTIAGGSSVVVNGTTVTVTDEHANATYGGMAPGADLFLAGTQLNTAHTLTAFRRMCDYADAQGKPLVVSNSWAGYLTARDGTNDVSDIVSQLFGNNHPNRICLFGSSNEAGKGLDGVGGGVYVSGQSSQASPLGTIIRSEFYIEGYGYQYLDGVLACGWTRATNAQGIGIKIHVINKNTGALQQSYTLTSTNAGTGSNYNTVNVSSYFGYNVYVYFDYMSINGKHQVLVYSGNYMQSGPNYALAIEVYPIGGSNSTIDIWAGTYNYFTGNVSTNGHNWVTGTDDMSMSDQSVMPDVISVGSYVSRAGSGTNPLGEISKFSSYAVEGAGPLGVAHPWITAPGDIIVSGYNHYGSHSASDLTVNNANSPYGAMSGTSMATPCAAGIVALWLQAAQESGKDLTLSEVKTIMKETAIRDSYVTSGTFASHFGNGKIDALSGIQYILDHYASSDPIIRPNPIELNYTVEPGETDTQQVTVRGVNLTGPITATLSDPSNVFSMSVSRANGQTLTLNANDVIDVTYHPLAVGDHSGTITLTSPGAEPVTIVLNGHAAVIVEATVCDGVYYSQTLPVLGLYHDENQHNQMIYPARKFEGTDLAGKIIKSLTFYPTNGSVTQSGTTYNFSGINFYNGSVTFKLANLPSGHSGFDADNPQFVSATLTPVKTIEMPSSANTSATTWVIDLEEEFVYDGGDLLIDVSNVPGDWGYTFFTVDTINDMNPGYVLYETSSFTTTYLPKMTIVAEAPINLEPSLSVDPTEVAIEDETDADRSATVAVISENLTGPLTTTASNHWSATLNQDNSEMTVTYHGKALHQVGSASVHSYSDDLHASVSADYLYTGPIYIIGDVANYYWNTNNGVLMNRDEDGIYTVTVSTQQSSDAAYISFTKQLGSNIDGYRFGPVSGGNWWLTNDTQGVYNPLDTVGNVNNIRVIPGYYVITIDSKNNQFMITPAVISSSVSPAEGVLDFGTVLTGNSSTQTITITNDGDLPFTPSLGGPSGAFSTDYVPTELAPGESVTITITYAPEYSGNDSETFTVSDGVTTYTWTLIGTAETPVTHGYMDNENVDFGERLPGETYTETVRIYNDGDLPFSPVIDTSGLDGVFAVTPTTGITIAPGEYYDLTVSFTPAEEGAYSGTFTVTIDGEPVTVTVTGSASETALPEDVIHSNKINVPVYKTEINVLSPFTLEEIDNDIYHNLPVNMTNSDVMVKVARPAAIERYDVYHHENSKTDAQNWAPGDIDDAVAYALHDQQSGSYLPYALDQETWASWIEQPAVTWADAVAPDMWVHLNDYVEVQNADTWYVPVVVADGKVSRGNTYGAPMLSSPQCQVSASVFYDRTDVGNEYHGPRTYTDEVTGQTYYYMTAEVNMHCVAPVAPEGATYHYECYKARAWRIWTPSVMGEGAKERTETYMGEKLLNGASDDAVIGCKDFTRDESGNWNYSEPAFCSPSGADVEFITRFYYKRVDNTTGNTLRSGGDGGSGGGGGGGVTPGPGSQTGTTDIVADKTVVDVLYVNPLGMTSDSPFEGVNIIVTRYSDGTTSTVKVLR